MRSLRRGVASCATVLVIVLTVQDVSGQRPVVVDSIIRCPTCQLRLGNPVLLHGPFEDGSHPDIAFVVRRAPDGRIYVVYSGDQSRISVYGADGTRTGLEFGQRGRGPGEFEVITKLLVQDSLLHAYDLTLARRSTFDVRTGRLVGTMLLPNHFESIVTPDGQIVLGGAVRTREAAGFPLHVHAPDGTWVRSFGVPEPALSPPLSILLTRLLAPAGPSTFWAAPINEYRLQLWDVRGRIQRDIRLIRNWFPPWQRPVSRSRDHPPSTTTTDMMVDGGLLWVIVHAPAPNWRDALSHETNSHGTLLLIPGRPFLQTILEVLDPTTGAVLARHRFAEGGWRFAAPGWLWRTWTDERDLPRAQLLPVRLERR